MSLGRHTLRRLTPAELSPSNEVEMEKRSLFYVAIHGVLGDSVKIPQVVPLDNDATQLEGGECLLGYNMNRGLRSTRSSERTILLSHHFFIVLY